MIIYASRKGEDHNVVGLTLVNSDLRDWLVTEAGFTPDEHSLLLAEEKILGQLDRFGISSIWTSAGDMIFLSEEAIVRTARPLLCSGETLC